MKALYPERNEVFFFSPTTKRNAALNTYFLYLILFEVSEFHISLVATTTTITTTIIIIS